MQRATYLIAVSSRAVEGGLLLRGEAQPGSLQSLILPPTNGDGPQQHATQLTETFLAQSGWSNGPAVVVLPTAEVSIRHLELAFSDARKVRQVLPFQLEDELLEDLSGYLYDYHLTAREDGRCSATVYLAPKALVQGILAACESRHLSVQRVVFSAQALAVSDAPEGRALLIYAGGEECFVAQVDHGRLSAAQVLLARPEQVLDKLGAFTGEGSSPQERLDALFAADDAPAVGDTGVGETAVGETGEAQAQVGSASADTTAQTGGDAAAVPATSPDAGSASLATVPSAAALAPTREVLRNELRLELEALRNETNRFVRMAGIGADSTVTVSGFFARFLQWSPETGEVVLNFEAERKGAAHPQPPFGILAELLDSAQSLMVTKGLNFHRRTSTWFALLREHRWGLGAMAGMLLLLALLGGGTHLARSGALAQRLARTEQALGTLLKLSPPFTNLRINDVLSRMESQLGQRRKTRQGAERLENYHYNVMVLLRDVSVVYQKLPQLTLDSFGFNAERVTLAGTTASYNDSEALRAGLGELEAFRDKEAKVTHSRSGQTIRYRLVLER